MSARTLPTLPSFGTLSVATSAELNAICTYQAFWANPPMFQMYQNTVQSIPTSTFTQITMDTPVWDTDTGRALTTPFSYVIPFYGRWEFKFGASDSINSAGSRISALYKNGVAVTPSQTTEPTSSTITIDMTGRPVTVLCNIGDVMGVYGWQSSGGALNTDTGAGASYFEGKLVSLASP